VPALPSSILEPLWVQVAALLPVRQVHHPPGCPRPRIADRVVFDKLIQVLVFGCGDRRIADATCSATTLRRRRDEWIALGLADRLWGTVPGADDQLFGLELDHRAVDGCITKAPCGGQVAGPSPVDRRKQGLKRSVLTDAEASRWVRCRHQPTVATMGCWRPPWTPESWSSAASRPVVHLDAGYDDQPCRQALAARGMVGQIATRGVPAPIQASRRWPVERTHAWGTRTASCAGAPSGAGWSSSSGWRLPTPPSSAAAWSVVPGPATAGTADPPPPVTTYWRRP
jgi:transposase